MIKINKTKQFESQEFQLLFLLILFQGRLTRQRLLYHVP